ncbi:MAG: HpcH/HpaI aldolase/citrate lyase family protein [Bacteroidetes bacterium]|nr:HpcH/HpaI aldolase/citrate lyase family protein [Bacteroidota bacterium]MBL6962655.1 HpcH/HpaI aldolase/citrate lyase family protein [Bacteroidota bacterium]
MNQLRASSGNKSDHVKSDCYVEIELKSSGGIQIELKSKVGTLYGDSIRTLIKSVLQFFNMEHAHVVIEDRGALEFVIAARLEAVIQLIKPNKKEFLFDQIADNKYHTERDQIRFSRLYLPGNSPKLFINSGIYQSHAIILDLEDSVAPDKKHEARFMVRNALRSVNFYGSERMVRINQIPNGLEDLNFIVPHHVNLILIPKVENAQQIIDVDNRIKEIRKEKGMDYPIWYMPIIESALGVINAFPIAKASANVVALAIGLEDYTADIGAKRSQEALESFYARSALVNAAKAAGIQAIDSVFSDVDDLEALKQTIWVSKGLGFEGMGCIHPRQIPVIHENYAPDPVELTKAKRIVLAFDEAQEKGLGVVSLGSKMIDPPVVKRALKLIETAISLNKLGKNWKESEMDN